MRLAIADPPYLGCGKSRYGKHHPEAHLWDDPETHIRLVETLRDFDGWVLACNPRDLVWLLQVCPPDVRIGAWCKTLHQIRVNVAVQYAWEPVIWHGGRRIVGRNPMVRDWLRIQALNRTGLVGSKPPQWTRWVLDMLGYDPAQDTVDDLFPGSGAVTNAIRQEVLI